MASHFQQLQTKGYTVFKDIIPKSVIVSLREHVRRGVLARPEAFLEIANPADVLNQEVKQEDPRMSALKRKFAAHRQTRKKMQRQRSAEKHRAKRSGQQRAGEDDEAYEFRTKAATSATASDIARLSQRITQQLAQLDPSDCRIQNDPQRLKAINEHRCNVWMTESQTIGKNFVRSDFGKILGSIASTLKEDNGGVDGQKNNGVRNPVLFCDRPLFQLPYGRPTMMHFAAPFFGLEEVRGSINKNDCGMNAISLWVPLEEPLAPTEASIKQQQQQQNSGGSINNNENNSSNGMTRRRARLLAQQQGNSDTSSQQQILDLLPTPIRVLEGSHILVRNKLLQDPKRYDMRLFRNDFNAVDSAIALWLRRFPELMPTPPHVAAMNNNNNNNNNSDGAILRAVELPGIRPGCVVAFDPYTFCGLGPNVSNHSQCVLQFLINSNDINNNTKASVHPYSWIRDWKSSSLNVDFGNDIVFPKLY